MNRLLLLMCTFLIALTVSCEHGPEKPRLLIKMATRDRYDKFFSTLDQYYAKLSQQIPYQFVISCDLDDPVMNSKAAIEKFRTYPHLSVYYGANKSKIEACNADLDKHQEFDILILASDDMVPVIQNFDQTIFALNEIFFPDNDGVLHFNDGCQGERVNTLPILGKKYYDHFGYIYYPEYKSVFCDDEMTQVAKILKKSIYINQVLIEHRHPCIGNASNDDLYRHNDQYWNHDSALYASRKEIQFGLNMR